MIVPRSPQLRVGDGVVDTPRRIVVMDDGRETRLTIKALQVLIALVEQAGQVVSREALFERVWPDTMPTDDVLTQAVTQLRKAFGDDRDAPRYIETIAKGGYRLVAEHTWLPAEEPALEENAGAASDTAEDIVEATAPPRRGWRPTNIGFLVACVVAVATLAGVWQWRERKHAREGMVAAESPAPTGTVPAQSPLRYRAITSAPGQERWPSLSPDGTTVAYSHPGEHGDETRLMLQGTSHVAARVLTTPPKGSADKMPVWSRNGTRIAFVRTNADGCALMVIGSNGGGERKIGDCMLGSFSLFDWTPDGRGLVMGGLRGPGEARAPLRILDVASGAWRSLDYPLADNDIDLYPRYSPDGRWLAFRRNISLGDLWLMPAEGGIPRPLTELKGDIRGWDWLPDSSGIVFSLVRGEGSLYAYALADATISALPPLAAGNLVFPDIAAEDWSMVFEIDQLRSGVFRVPLDAGQPTGERSQVFASSGIDMLPAVSPDGRTVAFISDRAMSVQLWIGDPDQPDTLRAIAGLQPIPRHPPVWSPDGRKLLVVGRGAGGDRLYQVDAGSDEVKALPVPGSNPAYAAFNGDPGRLLVGVDGGQGRLRLTLYALPAWKEVAAIDDVAIARYDRTHDQVYFTRPSRYGLWRADAELRGVSRVSDAAPHPQHYRSWSLVAGHPYYQGPREGCETSWMPLSEARDASGPGACLAREGAAIAGSATTDDQGAWLYVGLPLDQNIDAGWTSLLPLREALKEPPTQSSGSEGE